MEKTLPPTPRRLRRALREGDSPISLPGVRAGVLLAAVLLLPAAVIALGTRFRELLHTALAKPESVTPLGLVSDVVVLAGPLVLSLAAVALALGLAQTGFVVTFTRTAPRFDRLSPGKQLGELGRGLGAYDAARGAVVTIVLVGVGALALAREGAVLAAATSLEREGLSAADDVATRLLWHGALALAALSAADVAVKRAAWVRRWRMSPRDVVDERRESEGDPEIKRARRRAHEDLRGGTS